MPRTFKAPPLQDPPPARSQVGRPHLGVPSVRMKNPKARSTDIGWPALCKLWEEHYEKFFLAKRPWLRKQSADWVG